MKFGPTRFIGRYIVDIDGCLKSTNSETMTVEDVVALGNRDTQVSLVTMEIYGESVALGARDRIRLDEQTVTFFRTHGRGAERAGSASEFGMHDMWAKAA